MTTERSLWSKPTDALEARSADPDSRSSLRDAEPAPEKRANAPAPARPARAGQSDGRDWGWARTLRFAIVVSALFWLIVSLSVWAFFNAG